MSTKNAIQGSIMDPNDEAAYNEGDSGIIQVKDNPYRQSFKEKKNLSKIFLPKMNKTVITSER